MSEMIRQRDAGSYTFVTCIAPNGLVQLLVKPHQFREDGRENREQSHLYRLTRDEVAGLIAVLQILPDNSDNPG